MNSTIDAIFFSVWVLWHKRRANNVSRMKVLGSLCNQATVFVLISKCCIFFLCISSKGVHKICCGVFLLSWQPFERKKLCSVFRKWEDFAVMELQASRVLEICVNWGQTEIEILKIQFFSWRIWIGLNWSSKYYARSMR